MELTVPSRATARHLTTVHNKTSTLAFSHLFLISHLPSLPALPSHISHHSPLSFLTSPISPRCPFSHLPSLPLSFLTSPISPRCPFSHRHPTMFLAASVSPEWWGGPAIELYNDSGELLASVPHAFLQASKTNSWAYLTDVAEDVTGAFNSSPIWTDRSSGEPVDQDQAPSHGSYTLTLQGE